MPYTNSNLDEADDHPLIGQRRWLNVDSDESLWTIGKVVKVFKGQVTFERQHAPGGPTQTQVVVEEVKVPKLMDVIDDDVDHPGETEDVVNLRDPQEPTMLHVLRERYQQDHIFTNIGPVLAVINPYKQVPACKAASLHSLSRMEPESVPSHAFKIAAAAYSGLVEESPGCPQSILVSGESGAGKTETTKLLVACLALVSNSSGAIVESALESGLLLEAFGNARTVYNHNSSRFGKWCAVHFDDRGRMASCRLTAYLLEQSRIVSPAEGERNYHIFYHLLSGTSNREKTEWALLEASTEYHYTRGEATVPGINDKALWHETNQRLRTLGFASDKSRHALFQLLAAILALGNLQFAPSTKPGAAAEGVHEIADKKQLHLVSRLLQVPPVPLEAALVSRSMLINGETVLVNLDALQCADARDALAKTIYSTIFGHLTDRLNEVLDVGSGEDVLTSGRGSMHGERNRVVIEAADPDRYIGLLDIFGFENFRLNGFEQLCINFTNERLQQFFMDALIKRERAEYLREGVHCDHIEYPDNSAQVSLFDDKRAGIFAYLDDECRAPNGSDQKFVEKMHAAFAGKPKLYSKPRFGAAAVGADLGGGLDKLQFIVCHYAEDVAYTALNWLEKNRGRLHGDLAELLSASESPLLQMTAMAQEQAGPPNPDEKRLGGTKVPTVSGNFRAALRSLSATMVATHQHFIRCIKPNADKVPGKIDGAFVCRQLRYLGVHAVVEINQVGYPVKMLQADFVRKYRCLAFDSPALLEAALPRAEVCVNLLCRGGMPREGEGGWEATRVVQIGKTKIFMKPDVVQVLDVPRRAARAKAAVVVEAFARRRLARRVAHFGRSHALAVEGVRGVLDRPDEDSKLATIETRIADAGLVLDELIALHEQTDLPQTIAPLLQRCEGKRDALEMELRSLAHGLMAEVEATSKLRKVLHDAASSSKEDFLKLKAATAAAIAASQDICEELRETISKANKTIEQRFAAMVDEWEAEVKRQAALREETRREQCRAEAATLIKQIDRYAQHVAAEVTVFGADLEQSKPSGGAASEPEPSFPKLGGGFAKALVGAVRRGSVKAPGQMQANLPMVQPGAAAGAYVEETPTPPPPLPLPAGSPPESRLSGRTPDRKKGLRKASLYTYTQRNLLSAVNVPKVERLAGIVLRNGLDPQSTEAKPLLGFSPTLGINLSETNGVTRLLPTGTCVKDAHLQVGDVILEVEGEGLDGRKASKVIEELQRPAVFLTIARPHTELKQSDESDELPVGEHSGWLHMTRAKLLFIGGLTASAPSHKSWANLDDGKLTLFEETVRGEKRTALELSLEGAVCKAPPPTKKGSVQKGNTNAPELDEARRSAHKNPEVSKAATAGGKAGGESAAMPVKRGVGKGAAKGKAGEYGAKGAVMAELTARGLFPFRLSWPKKPEEMGVIVLAAHSAAERKGWVKALEAAIEMITNAAPTMGYLQKKQGRSGGLFKFGWNRRYFELLQATELTPASFVYYETEVRGEAPKGVIVLNLQSMLISSSVEKFEHAFAVSSKDETQPGGKTITTTLAAENRDELEMWTSAVERALHSFKPKGAAVQSLSAEEKALHKRTAQQLRLMLEYMGVAVDKTIEDKGALATEILRHRQMQSITKAQAVGSGKSRGDLTRKLKKDEARLMQRDVGELRALLEYMEVDFDKAIDSKERLVHLIINQKHLGEATGAVQRIVRAASSRRKIGRGSSSMPSTPRGETMPTVGE